MRVLLLTLCLVAPALCAKFKQLEWKDCGGSNAAIQFKSITLSPGVVKIPGDVVGGFEVDVKRALTGSSELDIKIYKHRRLLRPAKIPCLWNWGSCTYKPCDLVKVWETDGCPTELSNHNIPCTCPFPKSTPKMVNQKFSIPKLKWYLSWLAHGDYDVYAKLKETQTGEALGCLEAHISVDA